MPTRTKPFARARGCRVVGGTFACAACDVSSVGLLRQPVWGACGRERAAGFYCVRVVYTSRSVEVYFGTEIVTIKSGAVSDVLYR